MTAPRSGMGFCSLLCLTVAVLSAGVGPVEAAGTAVSVTLKSAAESMYAGESLPIYVIFENQSKDILDQIEFVPLESDFFTVERFQGETASRVAAPKAVIVVGFRTMSAAGLRPGKYTLLFDIHFSRKGVADRVRLIKEFAVDVRSPLQMGITSPVVNITAKPSSDTLRETSDLQLTMLVENKSPVPLENVKIVGIQSPVLELRPAKEDSVRTIAPFGTWTGVWNVQLRSDQAKGSRYGKHTLFFDTTYEWKYGSAQFTSETVTPVEISASFFGSEGFSQVFGIPLNLIVFVLPGFFLLFAYRGLTVALLKKGEKFTPTSKDGIFYSVVWSVILIFAYRLILGKDLYAFFTSGDLFAINAVGAVAGAIIPAALALTMAFRRRVETKLRFSESDGPIEVLRKTLARQPDPEKYEQVSVKEGDVQWSGIALSSRGEPLVLGPQYRITCQRKIGEELGKNKPNAPEKVKDFLRLLTRYVSSKEAKIDVAQPVKNGTSTHSGLKIFGATPEPTSQGVIPLIEFSWTDGARN